MSACNIKIMESSESQGSGARTNERVSSYFKLYVHVAERHLTAGNHYGSAAQHRYRCADAAFPIGERAGSKDERWSVGLGRAVRLHFPTSSCQFALEGVTLYVKYPSSAGLYALTGQPAV